MGKHVYVCFYFDTVAVFTDEAALRRCWKTTHEKQPTPPLRLPTKIGKPAINGNVTIELSVTDPDHL